MTSIDWNSTELAAGLAPYNLQPYPDMADRAATLRHDDAAVSVLEVRLNGLDTYVATWDIEAGVWLAVAVVRLIAEILGEYTAPDIKDVPALGGDPTRTLIALVPLEAEQEIAHRIWTGYEELYAILSRTQRKSGEKVWHRRATTTFFPQLIIDVDDAETLADDPTSGP